MSTECRKAQVTIDLPACACCTCVSTGDEPGTGDRTTQPVPTPFLVIPYLPGDPGARPTIPADKAL